MNKLAKTICLLAALSLAVGSARLSENSTRSIDTELSAQIAKTAPYKHWVTDHIADAAIADDWALVLHDETILGFITEALANNPSLAASAEQVARSQAILQQSRSSLFPSLSASGSATGTEPFENGSFSKRYSAGLSASWEVDLWGRIRNGVHSAEFDLAASQAFYRNAREALIAQVARTYVLAIEATQQHELNLETLTALETILHIVKTRHDLGAASRRERVLAISDVASARDSLEQASANIRTSLRAFEVLLGRYPSANVQIPTTFPDISQVVAVGQPADILRRRPDIQLDEYNVQVAFANIDTQKAARWPSLSLSADISGSSLELGDILDPASLAYSVGLRLADTLFDGGLTKGRIEVAKSNGRQALANYGQTVLDAFAEIESQIDLAAVLGRRHTYVAQSAAAARETLKLAEIQYKEGAIDLLDVLTFRQRSFQTDSTLLSIKRQQLEASITLYLALGGTGI